MSLAQITAFLVAHKQRVLLGGIISVIILVCLFFVIKLNYDFIKGAEKKQTQQSKGVDAVAADKVAAVAVTTYLPEIKRKTVDAGAEVRNPFTRNMTLKGVSIGENKSQAIIESGSTTYIAGEGEKIIGEWTIAEITAEMVVLESGTQTVRLEFGDKAQ